MSPITLGGTAAEEEEEVVHLQDDIRLQETT
jgi:hypothetical protein